MEILKATKPAYVFEPVDEIEVSGEIKGTLTAEIVDELSIQSDNRSPLFVEPVDELSVPNEYDIKLAKSTWDSLDVQGSGFELLGNPIVSRLENQDVDGFESKVEDKPRDWNCDLEIDYNDDLEIFAPEKPELEIEFLDDFKIETSKYDISKKAANKINETSKIIKVDKIMIKGKKLKKGKDTGISQDVIASGTVSTRDATRKVLSVKPRRRDEQESESITESVSHISKREIVDIKKKDKKKVKPRRRDEPDIGSESSHLSKKVVDHTTKKKRTYTKPRRRDEEGESVTETLSNLSRKVIVDIKKDKKVKKVVSVKPRRRGEPESETLSEDHLSKIEIVDIKKKPKKSVKPRRRGEYDIVSESSRRDLIQNQEEEVKMKVKQLVIFQEK